MWVSTKDKLGPPKGCHAKVPTHLVWELLGTEEVLTHRSTNKNFCWDYSDVFTGRVTEICSLGRTPLGCLQQPDFGDICDFHHDPSLCLSHTAALED